MSVALVLMTISNNIRIDAFNSTCDEESISTPHIVHISNQP